MFMQLENAVPWHVQQVVDTSAAHKLDCDMHYVHDAEGIVYMHDAITKKCSGRPTYVHIVQEDYVHNDALT